MLLERRLQASIEARLKIMPAVVLLGPRQVGKTTLAHEIAAASGSDANSVVLTLATQDGTVLADGVLVPFTSPVPMESSDSSEICERDGTLPN